MINKIFENRGEFLFITVPEDAGAFVVDNAMQYLVFKVPDNKKYLKDEESIIEDPENYNVADYLKTGGVKLPEGEFQIVGKAFRLEPNKVGLMGYSNFIVTMIKEKLVAKETFILKKVN